MNERLKVFYNSILISIKSNPSFYAVMFLATFLRFFKLDNQSLWYEELVTANYFIFGEDIFEMTRHYLERPDYHPVGMTFVFRLFFNLFGYSEFMLKLPSVFSGIGSVYLVYRIANKAYDKGTAISASLLMTLSGSQVYYSQELRYTALLIFLILLLTNIYYDFYLKLKEEPEGKFVWYYFSFTFLSAFASYIHYSGFFFSGFLAVIILPKVLTVKKVRILYLISYLLSVALFYPWLTIFKQQVTVWKIHRVFNVAPSITEYFKRMIDFSFVYQMYWANNFNRKYFSAFIISLLIVLMIFYIFRKNKDKKTFMAVFIISFPTLLIFANDRYRDNKFFYEKTLIYLVPFYYLLMARLINIIPYKKLKVSLVTIICLFFIYNPFITQRFYGYKYKTEFKKIHRVLGRSNIKNYKAVILCGVKYWHRYYLRKYNQEQNMEYKTLKNHVNSKEPIYAMWAHCDPTPKDFKFIKDNFISMKKLAGPTNVGILLLKAKDDKNNKKP